MNFLFKKSDRVILFVALFFGCIALAHPYLKGFLSSNSSGPNLGDIDGKPVELEDVKIKIPEFVEPEGRLDLNDVNKEKLTELPGIGPALAERIVTYRSEAGGFSALTELKEVSGIGSATLARIKDRLKVEGGSS